MLQTILKDGRKMRFVGGVPKEYEPQIEHIIEIPDGDELKVPEVKSGKLTLRDKTKSELATEQAIKDTEKAESDNESKIALQTRIDSMKTLGMDTTKEILKLSKI